MKSSHAASARGNIRKSGSRPPTRNAGEAANTAQPAGTAARMAAIRCLQAVGDGKPIGSGLNHIDIGDGSKDRLGLMALSPRDRALARMIWTTALRRFGQINGLLKLICRRGIPGGLAGHILIAGAAQILFLRIPNHAAVTTSVACARLAGAHRHLGLINAVLRKLTREGDAMLAEQADPVRLNLPDWIWQSWQRQFGPARAHAIAAAHLGEPPIDLMLRQPDRVDYWAEQFDDAELSYSRLPGGGLRVLSTGVPWQWPGFGLGAWWVQDYAAALPARMLGDDLAGLRIIDVCAAPGGKTAQLASYGAETIALDRNAKRLARLTENLHRLHLSAVTVCSDALLWQPDEPVDAVLVDAPCSGTGTFRRHPDRLRLVNQNEIARLTTIQAALLDRAADWVKPGGRLVYSVCSLLGEEGSSVFSALLAKRSDFSPYSPPVELGLPSAIVAAPGQSWFCPDTEPAPGIPGGMDGFFVGHGHQGVRISVTAQVVSCLVCEVPTHGVWGQEQWAREAPAEPSCPLRPSKNKGCPPAGCGAEPCCFSLGSTTASRAAQFCPFPIPWTKSMGVFLFVLPRFSCVAYAFTFPHMSSM